MALPVLHVPAGAIIRLPAGATVQLKAGEHYNAPAGTLVPTGPVGSAPTTLTTETELIAAPTPGQEVPGLTSHGTPAGPPQPQAPRPPARHQRPWQDTPQGARVANAYVYLHETVARTIPGQRQSLRARAARPLGG